MPHFTLDLRAEFRAGVVEPWLAGHAAGETPNPCVGCNGHVRLDAMLAFADALGAAALATGHYARVSEDGLLRSAADPAKDQAYMLCALSPATLRAHALPARRADQAGGAGAGRRGRPAGRLEGRLAGPLLPRRHRPRGVPGAPRRRARAPGGDRRPRRARARPPPRPPRLHGRPAQGDRRRGGRAALRARHRRAHEPRDGRRAGGAGDARGGGARRAAAPAGRRGRRGAPALPLASRCRARSRRRGGAGSRSTSASRPTPPRRARPRACTPATWSSATARSRSDSPAKSTAAG